MTVKLSCDETLIAAHGVVPVCLTKMLFFFSYIPSPKQRTRGAWRKQVLTLTRYVRATYSSSHKRSTGSRYHTKKRAEKTEVREAARQAALKEIKERIKKTKDEKKAKKAEVLSKATKVGSRDARFCEMRRWEWWFRFIRACIANNKHLDQFFSRTARRHQRETIKRRSDEVMHLTGLGVSTQYPRCRCGSRIILARY
ncbi:hypothetical protein SELMODRAFT_423875 [Selaginella moellendorffii]|uniref:Uncharacterized protein n=1 Tax=Selaginella moellendorffii TaxID=88036 RepID=D8SN32_SELML|nr:hypothetical protein SELMODRAFT_423875 [Selaginella moellendorffii]